MDGEILIWDILDEKYSNNIWVVITNKKLNCNSIDNIYLICHFINFTIQ
jgi:hypothetical protein